jgi:hypothetical protein
MSTDFVPFLEGSLQQVRELERQLLEQDIEVQLAKPPAKACCGGKCGCGSKMQLLIRPDDAQRVAEVMRSEWLEAVRREGTLDALVPLGTPATTAGEAGEPPCPACGFVGALVEGACGDCGLQLE